LCLAAKTRLVVPAILARRDLLAEFTLLPRRVTRPAVLRLGNEWRNDSVAAFALLPRRVTRPAVLRLGNE